MVDEEGIRLASPWWLCKAFRPAGCLTESSRGAFDPAKNQTFDFLEVCTGAVCQPNADVVMWLFGFLCGSQLQHELSPEAVLKDWSSVFPDMFLHLGSDEVPGNCWNNSKDLAWMILWQRWWVCCGLSWWNQAWGRRHETRWTANMEIAYGRCQENNTGLLKSWIILCYHVGLELPLCKVFYLWTAK